MKSFKGSEKVDKSWSWQPEDGRFLSFDHLTFYVSNAKQAASYFITRMGFEFLAYQGLETGHREYSKHAVKQNQVIYVNYFNHTMNHKRFFLFEDHFCFRFSVWKWQCWVWSAFGQAWRRCQRHFVWCREYRFHCKNCARPRSKSFEGCLWGIWRVRNGSICCSSNGKNQNKLNSLKLFNDVQLLWSMETQLTPWLTEDDTKDFFFPALNHITTETMQSLSSCRRSTWSSSIMWTEIYPNIKRSLLQIGM